MKSKGLLLVLLSALLFTIDAHGLKKGCLTRIAKVARVLVKKKSRPIAKRRVSQRIQSNMLLPAVFQQNLEFLDLTLT